MRAPENTISMYQAFAALGGPLLPHDAPDATYAALDPAVRSQIRFGRQWDGVPASPVIAHAVRPPKLRAWIPSIRRVLDETFSVDLDGDHGGTVDLFAWCQRFIQVVTARILFGDAVPLDIQQEWIRLVQLAEPDEAFNGNGSWKTAVEATLGRERSIYGTCRQLIYPFLEKEMQAAGQSEKADGSVLASFAHQWYHRLKGDAEALEIAKRRIANDLFFFSFAAVVNSFVMSSWILYHVIRNTAGCGTRIRQELESVPDEEANWPELEKTVLEIGRLYTPAVTFRLVKKPVTLPSCGATLPEGSQVIISNTVCHRNPEYFRDPCHFDPTRYNEGREEHVKAGALFQPFGAGAHPCTGKKLAMYEIAMFTRAALRRFDWELDSDAMSQEDDPYTSTLIANVPGHPALDPAQKVAIWQPLAPVMVKYKPKNKA